MISRVISIAGVEQHSVGSVRQEAGRQKRVSDDLIHLLTSSDNL